MSTGASTSSSRVESESEFAMERDSSGTGIPSNGIWGRRAGVWEFERDHIPFSHTPVDAASGKRVLTGRFVLNRTALSVSGGAGGTRFGEMKRA